METCRNCRCARFHHNLFYAQKTLGAEVMVNVMCSGVHELEPTGSIHSRTTPCDCKEYVPNENLEYLEYLYNKQNAL